MFVLQKMEDNNSITIKADYSSSAIIIKNSIFVVSGVLRENAFERLDFKGDELINQEVIETPYVSSYPVLFEVPADYCV